MDLGSPYRAVMSGLHGEVLHELAVLEAADGVSGRQLARRLGASAEGVRRVLVELLRHGIVVAEEAPPARRYRINRQHVMFGAVQMLVGVRDQLFSWIASRVGEWAPPPSCVAVYGSAARGDGTVDSDIDLLVVAPDEIQAGYYTWHSTLGAELLDEVTTWSGNRAELVEYQSGELRARLERGDALAEEIVREAVTVFGADLDILVRRPIVPTRS